MTGAGKGRVRFQLCRRLGVAEAHGAQGGTRLNACWRCARQVDSRHQFRRQGGGEAQVGDPVIGPFKSHVITAEQGLQDLCVFDQTLVAGIVLRVVAQLLQVLDETARNHVEVHRSAMQEGE